MVKGLRVAATTTGSGSFVMVNELFWRGRRWAHLRWALSRFWEEDPDDACVSTKIFVRSGGSKMSSFRCTEH